MKPSKTTKKPINFRLKQQTLLILSLLEKKLHTSKTAVVEKALEYYASQKLKHYNPIMQFAGIFSDAESDEMLSVIKCDRRNKDIKVKL
ncbi:MAG: hypothetical protein ACD_42C00498G0011 [uncultured bacterium]|nr:MAG: hypothetical protein ACD_42C00498G0011 [uncultured bacterium]OGT33484.1 MAG: hypothetical protein A3C44_03010 [Gammaproteobacteria bacterium RIFCSPHIGHO2_02_FULL_39_13]